ncbi:MULTISPECIES: type II toxin-antitoxin system RelE/ParE family toxin [Rhizobium/Agrobacterium group]|nr:type II toxin-antitoxin system RelE/ParE family toxin [Agrobacterium vitis]
MGKTADLPAKSTGNPSSTICAAAFKPVGEYRLRPAAEQDLREIWSYGTERWSHDQAERYLNLLFDKFEEIAAFPDSVRMCLGSKRIIVGVEWVFTWFSIENWTLPLSISSVFFMNAWMWNASLIKASCRKPESARCSQFLFTHRTENRFPLFGPMLS